MSRGCATGIAALKQKDSKCKGPEVIAQSECSGNSKTTSMAKEE